MSNQKEDTEKPQAPKKSEVAAGGEQEEVLDLDEDLAAALGSTEDSGEEVDVDKIIDEADPEFSEEMANISKEDFTGVVIDKENVSEEVDEAAVVPSRWKVYWQNTPEDLKTRYFWAMGIMAVCLPLAALIYMGKVLPSFDLPYVVSMQELTKNVYSYPTDGPQVPLFDEFRTNSHTVQLPKTVINLKSMGGQSSYGEFQFSLVLRDEELSVAIKTKESELLDLVQRVLEQITWKELQSPIGKEKVKKVIRHRINEFLEGNVILGVYYSSVILEK